MTDNNDPIRRKITQLKRKIRDTECELKYYKRNLDSGKTEDVLKCEVTEKGKDSWKCRVYFPVNETRRLRRQAMSILDGLKTENKMDHFKRIFEEAYESVCASEEVSMADLYTDSLREKSRKAQRYFNELTSEIAEKASLDKRAEAKEREENIISNKESLERVRRHVYDAGGIRSSLGSAVFGLSETDIEYEKLMQRQKKYTQADMDEAVSKQSEEIDGLKRSIEVLGPPFVKTKTLQEEIEGLKKKLSLSEFNYSVLKDQKEMVEKPKDEPYKIVHLCKQCGRPFDKAVVNDGGGYSCFRCGCPVDIEKLRGK